MDSSIIVSRVELLRLRLRVAFQLLRILFKKSGSLVESFNLLKEIRQLYYKANGERLITKAAKVSGRYYWRLGSPGFPSKASVRLHENEINRFFPPSPKGLRTLFFAITNKCPLNCEHCFEWNNLNKKEESLTTDED